MTGYCIKGKWFLLEATPREDESPADLHLWRYGDRRYYCWHDVVSVTTRANSLAHVV
jgi:hypothetical protein